VQTVEKAFENGAAIMLAGHFLVKATNCNFWVINTSINWETRLADLALLKTQVLELRMILVCYLKLLFDLVLTLLEPKCAKFIAANLESQPSENWYNSYVNNANLPIIDTYHHINETTPGLFLLTCLLSLYLSFSRLDI
jgi:hypothetical protein